MPNDIHLEILPYDLNNISSKDECIEQQIDENLQVNILVAILLIKIFKKFFYAC